jgi:hypothetical protein
MAGCLLAESPSNAITITDLSGARQPARVLSISRVFAEGEIPQFAQARVGNTALLTQCDAKTRWPDGSLQHAIVSFVADIPANGSVRVAFVNQPDGNNTGFLTKEQILDPSAPWASTLGARITAAQGAAQTADLREMLAGWDGLDTGPDGNGVRYWLKGPVVTQLIVEDKNPNSLRYDFGWDCSTNSFPCAGDWAVSAGNSPKPLHPIYVVTIHPGAAPVKIEMILENVWVTKLKDQSYALDLRIGNPLGPDPVFFKAAFNHYAKTRWRKVFWSGPPPAKVKIDYNLPYLIHTRALPSFDLTKVVSDPAVAAEAAAFRFTDQGEINGHAQWQKDFGTTGGRAEIGLFPRWSVRYLYTFDPRMREVMEGNAACSGYIPIHLRESDASKTFDDGGTAAASGRAVSLYARPGNLPSPLAPLSRDHGWTVDQAHQGDFAFLPYLIEGDWYYLEELWFWSAFNLRAAPAGACYYCRHNDWGYFAQPLQARGQAWAMRTLIHTAFLSPDGLPEKTYFTKRLNYNIAIQEGRLGITDGSFYDPDPASPWSWGRNTVATEATAAVPRGGPENPLGLLSYDSSCAVPVHQDLDFANRVQYCDAPWMYHFLEIVWMRGLEMGFRFDGLARAAMKLLIHEVTDPQYNPWLVGAFHFPVIRKADGKWFTSWKEIYDAWTPEFRNHTSWSQVAPDSDDSNVDSGYPHIAKAAASFAPGYSDGPLTGQAAWDWLDHHVGYQSLQNDDPKWALVPRRNQQTASGSGSSIPIIIPPRVRVSGSHQR